ncbi:MAG: lysophospholipid acyltransferase family protein [Bacteroidaceae bacterium]|nr:lysophospholipid acyltransferase family protein [Bacteroidaceae bacterium]
MEEKLKWYQKITFELFWVLCLLISIMPRCIRYYILKPLIGALLILTHYRYKVIVGNLTKSFPQKSTKEIKQITRKYYMFLAEVAIDIISLVGASEERKDKAVDWLNAKEINERLDGKDWIAMGAHYGCWEYLPLWSRQQMCNTFMSVYHPLTNKVFDQFFLRLRKLSSNIVTVAMRNTFSYYLKNRNKGIILGLLSDQSPALRADTQWFRFLNQDTAFIDGAESVALKYKLPIYFAYTKRKSPGRYTVVLEEIYDGQETVEKCEITRRYARRMEEMILECPELWMWSHKRWKHSPEKQERLYGQNTLPK